MHAKTGVYLLIVCAVTVLGVGSFFMWNNHDERSVMCVNETKLCSDGSIVGHIGSSCIFAPCPETTFWKKSEEIVAPLPQKKIQLNVAAPIEMAGERVSKKPFGIHVTPASSPVFPEHFHGYHTGTDFEIFSGEEDMPVQVSALCGGKIIVKQFISGYGGVFATSCLLDDQEVTVLYGHLALSSIAARVGEFVEVGDFIGILGAGKSRDTDGERKHLHVSIHRGTTLDVRGYVADKKSLAAWIDPCFFVCEHLGG